jgi:hypothetical protein
MLVFNKYFYKNKKSKLYIGDSVAVLNDFIYQTGGSKCTLGPWDDGVEFSVQPWNKQFRDDLGNWVSKTDRSEVCNLLRIYLFWYEDGMCWIELFKFLAMDLTERIDCLRYILPHHIPAVFEKKANVAIRARRCDAPGF